MRDTSGETKAVWTEDGSYEAIVSRILELPKFTTKNEPAHTREFLRRLGNPQEKFKVIHVAGSNGKGSVCAFLNSVLVEGGISVGMFTSPHLIDIRERFVINGEMCGKGQFLGAEKKVRTVVEKMTEEGLPHPTFFEYIFGIGMVMFQEAGLSWAILETGLGGRLDATNTVEKPSLVILTSISLEHTEILGDTIEAIAAEKAGIIKKGVPVIFDANRQEASRVILQKAEQMQALAKGISKENINILLKDGKTIDFSLDCGYDVNRVKICFPAEYQAQNAGLALAAANWLRGEIPLATDTILRGFFKTKWRCRMEEAAPGVYLDGAHNVSGVAAFLDAAAALSSEPAILVFSMVREKNYPHVIRMLCRQGCWDCIILTKISDNPRALEIDDLEELFVQELGSPQNILTVEKPEKALKEAMSRQKEGQKVFAMGSLYLVGELLAGLL